MPVTSRISRSTYLLAIGGRINRLPINDKHGSDRREIQTEGNAMMKKLAVTGLAVAVITAAALSTGAGEAQAKKWYWSPGAAAAGGFVAGAVIGSALAAPRYAPPPAYVEPGPIYYGPPEPWTPAWYEYCSSKYRTFNPETGYYFYKPGRARFCR